MSSNKQIRKCVKKANRPLQFMQLTETNRDEVIEWCCGKPFLDGSIKLITPESDEQIAKTYYYIIKGFSEKLGWHFWPVAPDYFEENYIEV